MWYMLAPPDTGLRTTDYGLQNDTSLPTLYAGLREGIPPDTLRAAIEDKTVEQHLIPLHATPGGALFIPGGLVHAIGEGCLIYEVQQNSNTTFRLYDWDRVGSQGKPRRLHIAQSFNSIDWTLPPPSMTLPTETRKTLNATWADVVSCEFFKVRKLTLRGKETVPVDWTTFHALFVEAGEVAVEAGGETHYLTAGTSCLIPASALRYVLTPTPNATLLVTTL
jgi:mannose-6-phosphate isomerase